MKMPSGSQSTRILLGFSYYEYPVDVRSWVEAWLARLRAHGIIVDGFCLTLNPPGPRLTWSQLETRWRIGDKDLLAIYERLAYRLEQYDVFVNWNGINLHPDFVQQLPTFNVYGCFDDPEQSDYLSRPVAWAYDLCMVGNVAEVETYRRWGVREAYFWPMGFMAVDYDPSLTRERILNGGRDVDITLLCERTSPWRRKRLDQFVAAFPQGAYYGRGWPNGFLPEEQRAPLLQRTKIGINMHNSTGPINFRTYYLPANGVMQICDNKSHLGRIFELDKEVVGFDTIDEAIELCRYYLAHDDERRRIAAAGWERALRDYNEVTVFRLMMDRVERLQSSAPKRPGDVIAYVHTQRRQAIVRRGWHYVLAALWKLRSGLSRLYRWWHGVLAGYPIDRAVQLERSKR
jgi:spore maturation protein CgeB